MNEMTQQHRRPSRQMTRARVCAPPRSRSGLLAGVLLALAGLALLGGAQPLQAQTESAVLRPGDMIRVQVWRQPEFTGEFFVTDAGVVGHPLYRQVIAAGRSADEVRNSMMRFLSQFETEPNFVVEVFLQVAVGGEVRAPSVQHLRLGTSLAEAVQQAGGATERGALGRVLLRRDGVQFRGDLQDPASDFRRIEIRSGDEIVVERRRAFVRDYLVPIVSVVGSIASIIRLAR